MCGPLWVVAKTETACQRRLHVLVFTPAADATTTSNAPGWGTSISSIWKARPAPRASFRSPGSLVAGSVRAPRRRRPSGHINLRQHPSVSLARDVPGLPEPALALIPCAEPSRALCSPSAPRRGGSSTRPRPRRPTASTRSRPLLTHERGGVEASPILSPHELLTRRRVATQDFPTNATARTASSARERPAWAGRRHSSDLFSDRTGVHDPRPVYR